jgi:hypothetical protein
VKRVEILDLPEDARELIRECEVQGTKTFFERGGRPVAVLLSHDEYVALRETIALSNDALLYARIESADEEMRTGRLIASEDLWADARLERLRIVESLEQATPPNTRPALERLADDPIAGAPLMEPFEGLWVYADSVKVYYRIVSEGRFVVVLAVV